MKFIRNLFQRKEVREEKNTLEQMFSSRTEIFAFQTEQILTAIPGIVQASSLFLNEKESFKSGGKFEWNEISLANVGSTEPLIVLVGTLRFPVGSEVELKPGEKTIVTTDTAQYFLPRIARIAIPLKYAESSKEDVLQYLKTIEASQISDAEEIKKALHQVLGSPAIEEGHEELQGKVIKKQDGVTTEEGFDMTQLTEEQRQRLAMSQKMGRG